MCPLSTHVTQLTAAHRCSVTTEERQALTAPQRSPSSAPHDQGGAVGRRSKHEGVLNSDKRVQQHGPAQANQSRTDGRTAAGPRRSFLSAPESMQSSLKFTARLHAEDTWQAPARAGSPPHTTSGPRGPENQDVSLGTPLGDAAAGRGSLREAGASLGWRFRLACRVSSHFLTDLCVCPPPRFPRGAPTGFLPFYPGIDDQARLPTGRRDARHR